MLKAQQTKEGQMAVFTPLSKQEIESLLSEFKLGPVMACQPIEQGTVNTNYDVTTSQGRLVLTLLEAIDMPLALSLTKFCAFVSNSGLKAPKPIPHTSGSLLGQYQDKSVVVCEFILGTNDLTPSSQLCFNVGQWLGKLHQIGDSYPEKIPNQMGHTWRANAAQKLNQVFGQEDNILLEQVMSFQSELIEAELLKGMVHYDLFRDNVLVLDNEISGVIDFYYACYDQLLLDICICLNDWCTNWRTQSFDLNKASSFIKGYQTQRVFNSIEWSFLGKALALMAAHYWMSRSLTLIEQKDGYGHFEKDPQPFKMLLLEHLNMQKDINSLNVAN